jgi:HK97 gp10 family phage protein
MASRVEWYGKKLASQAMSGAQKGVNAVTQKIAVVAADKLTRGAGVDRGKLKRNIKTQKAKRVGGQIVGKVGPTQKVWYGKFLQFGARKHAIKPKTKSLLAWRSAAIGSVLSDKWGTKIGYALPGATIGKGVVSKSLYFNSKGRTTKQKSRAAWIFAGEVNHPGMAAREFLTKALDEVWPQVPEIIAAAAGQTMSK